MSQTHGKFVEHNKVDLGMAPTSLASTAKTGPYYSMANYTKAAFLVMVAAIADTKTVIAQVLQASDAAATGAKVITGAVATITSPLLASKILITTTTVIDTNVITVTTTRNGIASVQIFTCEDTTPVAADGEFASGANDTAAMVNLAAVINSLLPDCLAVPSTNTITITSRDPGRVVIGITAATGTMVPSIVECAAYVEIEDTWLDDDNDFDHVAIRVTTDATIVCSSTLVRAGGRYSPDQAVAAGLSSL